MLNRVVIVGRLVRDPELRKTASDRSVVAFTVALDNRTTNNGEKSTSYIPCTAWNSTAESIAKFMKKGSLVGVDGHLNQRSYTANDGRKVSVVEVIADSVQFLEKKMILRLILQQPVITIITVKCLKTNQLKVSMLLMMIFLSRKESNQYV